MACVSTLVQAGFPVASRGAKINATTRTTNYGASAGPEGRRPLSSPAAASASSWTRTLKPSSPSSATMTSAPTSSHSSSLSTSSSKQAAAAAALIRRRRLSCVSCVRPCRRPYVLVATAHQTLEEVERHFEAVSGLPVVDGSSLSCVGVVVKNDRTKASHGPKSKVAEIMTAPAITLSSDTTVMGPRATSTDAAALMLKKKIHRLPVVNQDRQVIGMVTSADVLRELEGLRLRV